VALGASLLLLPSTTTMRAGFWDSAGYPQDEEIGRRVRNIS
jgi:hypothetical protein